MIKNNSTLDNQTSTDDALVVVLLCTFNGALYLAEQLASIEAQTHKNWIVIASDDKSTDQTIEILRQYQDRWPIGKLFIRSGPQRGFCMNFLSLACDGQIRADYYAFCDQDDIWLPTKLSVSLLNIIANQIERVPYLYCGRTWYVNKNLKKLGLSPLFVFPRTFRNALVQSIAGGNTMVFNHSTKLLIEEAGHLEVASHDWWLYLLVTGVMGEVFYDPIPQLLYRQHENAVVGGRNSLSAKIKRIWMLFQGRYMNWNTQNIKALLQVKHLLEKNHKDILIMFDILRRSSIKDRIRLLGVCGIYRQTRRGTISLYFATIINKI